MRTLQVRQSGGGRLMPTAGGRAPVGPVHAIDPDRPLRALCDYPRELELLDADFETGMSMVDHCDDCLRAVRERGD